MLRSLSIRDVVLIDRLDLAFQPGLCVLTGETGAGKSILLDALGLALGMRAEARLVRSGTDQAVVTAAFEPPRDHPAYGMLAEQGLDGSTDDGLVLRRILAVDGRSRAFVNDQPVSVGLLKRIGESLVEIHGQFETQGLLNPAAHRGILDSYGGLEAQLLAVAGHYRDWRKAEEAMAAAEAQLEQARREEEWLRHAVEELTSLAPTPGEEEQLADRRHFLMHGEKLMEALNAAAAELTDGRGVEGGLRGALRHLERIAEKAEGRLDDVIAGLDRAAIETGEAIANLERISGEMDLDPRALEAVEERLFALRAMARKHDVQVDQLAALKTDLAGRLAAIDDGGTHLVGLREAAQKTRRTFEEGARKLSAARIAAAQRLDKMVAAELPPLKLDRATFVTAVTPLEDPQAWSETGCDRVAFQVATNPGVPPGPLNKIASGGEMARFMLALKVCLAEADNVPTLIFDEVDSGVGGAVASAVGQRLARLAGDQVQVLVVTHSPQVAALGSYHMQVSKSANGNAVSTTVRSLGGAERREEVARMLAGAHITDEARAAADSLMKG